MGVSSLPTFLAALADDLGDELEPLGVPVFSGDVPADERGNAYVQLGDGPIDVAIEYPNIDDLTAEETYDVPCTIAVLEPGGGEELAVAARERAFQLLEVIHENVSQNATMMGTVLDAGIVSLIVAQRAVAEGRVCVINFVVRVSARFIPA